MLHFFVRIQVNVTYFWIVMIVINKKYIYKAFCTSFVEKQWNYLKRNLLYAWNVLPVNAKQNCIENDPKTGWNRQGTSSHYQKSYRPIYLQIERQPYCLGWKRWPPHRLKIRLFLHTHGEEDTRHNCAENKRLNFLVIQHHFVTNAESLVLCRF